MFHNKVNFSVTMYLTTVPIFSMDRKIPVIFCFSSKQIPFLYSTVATRILIHIFWTLYKYFSLAVQSAVLALLYILHSCTYFA